MQTPLCYLASPYTHPDPAVREQRFKLACRAAAHLIRSGQSVYSPIAHSHPICDYGVASDWRQWEEHDLRCLAICDEVVVLKLEGWEHSVGVQAEIAAARALGKPVSFIEYPAMTRTDGAAAIVS